MAFEGAHSIPHIDLADLNGSVKFSFVRGGNPVSYDIRFDWAAIARMQGVHGDKFLDVAADAFVGKSVNTVCELLSYATGKTREEIMEDSPPVLFAVEALSRAWQIAWQGSAIQTPYNPAADDEEEEEEPKKQIGLLTWLVRRVLSAFKPG